MKKALYFLAVFILLTSIQATASAHYGMLVPSDSMVMQGESRTITLNISFSHPFEGVGMEMERPEAFGVITDGKNYDLLEKLRKSTVMDATAWKADYRIKKPGAYTFYIKPKPYWEPAEDCFIIHYTKTVVAAFGDDQGWDREVGLKTEIVPLSRPFALYTGNVFQGIVKLDGKAVPFAEVEIEYYNLDKKAVAPSDYMITQTIKTDKNGVFTYAAPRAGWWGFAALNPSDKKMKYKGEDKDVELGAVLWVKFHDWKEK